MHTVVVAIWTEKMLSPLHFEHHSLKKFWPFSADRIDRDKPVMIFAETLLLFLWKISETEKPSWQQPSLFFFIGSLSTCTEMLSGMKAMTGPIWRARNLFLYTKNIITYLFILQMRKYFMQRIEQKWIENWTSLFCGKLDFWRGRSDTAAPCGHGFHNHHVSTLTLASDVWPRDIRKYTLRPIVAAFLGRSWENMKTSINIVHYH